MLTLGADHLYQFQCCLSGHFRVRQMGYFEGSAAVDAVGDVETALITDRVVAQSDFLDTLGCNQEVTDSLTGISRQLILVEKHSLELRKAGKCMCNKLDPACPNPVVLEAERSQLLLIFEHAAELLHAVARQLVVVEVEFAETLVIV